MPDEKRSVFISHIHAERPIAFVLQRYIREAFRDALPVFVSSDDTSIGGGRKWFNHIVENLRLARVVLVLVSTESSTRERIDFEAGFGDGAGAAVIPVSITNFALGQLPFPLLGYQGRLVADLKRR